MRALAVHLKVDAVAFAMNVGTGFAQVFLAGHFDTKFIEQRFNLEEAEEGLTAYPEIAAIMAAVLAHRRGQLANQVVSRGKRDTSNWKWVGRYERMHR